MSEKENLNPKVYNIFFINLVITTIFEIALFLRMFLNKFDTSTLLLILGIGIITIPTLRLVTLLTYSPSNTNEKNLLIVNFVSHAIILILATVLLTVTIANNTIPFITFASISILFDLSISIHVLPFISELSKTKDEILKQILITSLVISLATISIVTITIITPYFNWIDRGIISLILALLLLISLIKSNKNIYKDIKIVNDFISLKGNDKEKIVSKEFSEIMVNLEKIMANQYYSNVVLIKSIKEINNEIRSIQKDIDYSIQTLKKVKNELTSKSLEIENNLNSINTIKETSNEVKILLENYSKEILPILEFTEKLQKSYVDINIKLNTTNQKNLEIIDKISSALKNMKRLNEMLPIISSKSSEIAINYSSLNSIVKDLKKISNKLNFIRVSLDIELRKANLDQKNKEKLEVISKKMDELFYSLEETTNSIPVEEGEIKIENEIKTLTYETKEIQALTERYISTFQEFMNNTKSLVTNLENSNELLANLTNKYNSIRTIMDNISLLLDKNIKLTEMISEEIKNANKTTNKVIEFIEKVEETLKSYYLVVSSINIRIPKFVEDAYEM